MNCLRRNAHDLSNFSASNNSFPMIRILTVALLVSVQAFAQDSYNSKVAAYIERYKDIAVAEMQRTGIPASIKLAQAILESGCGESSLATKGNNHFGIKCHDSWTGKTMLHDDDRKNECFRCYNHPEESFRDHSDFLTTRQRYASLFEIESTDYKRWAHGLKQAGYATNPKYAELLINNIEKYELHKFDVYENFAVAEKKVTGSGMERSPVKVAQHTSQNVSSPVVYVNHIRAVRVKPNETLEMISQKHRISMERLLKYNELPKPLPLQAGSYIFLQPKRARTDSMYHIVGKNQTIYDISQLYGVKMSALYMRNNMEPGTNAANGEVIYLREKRQSTPLLRGNEEPRLAQIKNPSTAVTTNPPTPVIPSPAVAADSEQPISMNEPDLALAAIQTPINENTTVISGELITTTEVENVDYYTVKPKDTLYSIARAYGLSVQRLMEINQLGSDVISSGMRLRVKQ